jgi:hypothetical protein
LQHGLPEFFPDSKDLKILTMNFLIKNIFPGIIAVYLCLLFGGQADATRKQYLILFILFFLITKYLLSILYVYKPGRRKKGLQLLITGIISGAVLLAATDTYLVPKFKATVRASFSITALGQKNDSSHASEVWILSIKNRGATYPLNKIPLNNAWETKDGKILSYQQQPSTLNLTIDQADKPVLTLLKHPWSGKVQINDGKTVSTIDLYKEGNGDEFEYPVLNLESHMTQKELNQKFLYYIITFLFLFILSYVLLAVIQNKVGYYYLINLLLWIMLFLLPSDLVLGPGQIILLLILSIITGRFTSKAFEPNGFFAGRMNVKEIVFFVLLLLYGSFACVGNSLFFVGQDSTRLQKVAFFIVFMGWFTSLAISFLQLTYGIKARINYPLPESPKMTRSDEIKLWGLIFIILTSIWLIYLLAFYPAIMSSDSLDQWEQATHLKPLANWHPVFHTLLNRTLLLIWESPAVLATFQILFMAAVSATFLTFFAIRGIPKKWLLLFSLLFALFPANGVNLVTLWKDIPFTISLLWVTYFLVRLIDNKSYFNHNRLAIAGLIVALVFTALLRHNGMLVFIFLFLGLLIYCIRFKIKPVLLCTIVSLILVSGFKIYVATNKNIVPLPPEVKLIGAINGMAAVIIEKEVLAGDINQKMDSILPHQVWIDLYSPYWANRYQFETNGAYMNHLARLNSGEIMKMYARTLYHHPFVVIRDRLQGADIVWNVSRPTTAFNSNFSTELDENNHGLKQKGNMLKPVILHYLRLSVDLGSEFFWRGGIYNIFMVLLAFYCVRTGSRLQLMYLLPWFGATLSLMPALLWQEFRYVYFIPIIFWFLWLTSISPVVRKPEKK